MFDAKARAPGRAVPPSGRPLLTVVRNSSTGQYFEVMPREPGLHAERLQRALLQRPMASRWERLLRALGDWIVGSPHG